MADPFISEIRMFGFNWAPRGWSLCDGQILPINQNQALYSLIGTAFGGDGRTTFGLPDLRGRTPVHPGVGPFGFHYDRAQRGGEEEVTLTAAQMPQHTHLVRASTEAADAAADYNGAFFSASSDQKGSVEGNSYRAATNLVQLNAGTVTNTGGSQSHNNMQPSLAVSFAISLTGVFPSRN
ncbi:phage tail protein [Pseudoalteromonas spongiae]|uniref:Tail fiber protein n=1 Tax=Pseudoalteromonas spongiae TaxID=298657 RepID=A0ABU8EYZ3_9GAMM